MPCSCFLSYVFILLYPAVDLGWVLPAIQPKISLISQGFQKKYKIFWVEAPSEGLMPPGTWLGLEESKG